jgi:hypothetical protein
VTLGPALQVREDKVGNHFLHVGPPAVAPGQGLMWGRDEPYTGDMWNSNSLISWLLANSGHYTGTIHAPAHGRAPGWDAGLVLAARQQALPSPVGCSV